MNEISQQIKLGKLGEDYVAESLTAKGWVVLDRNWRCKQGEIDLVAFDPIDDCLVFVEVKTRSGGGFGSALEAITEAKVSRLRRLCYRWCKAHSCHPRKIRIDGIGVTKSAGYQPIIDHVRGIG